METQKIITILKCIIYGKPMIDNCIWLNLSFILFTMKLNMVKKQDSVQIGVFKGSRDIQYILYSIISSRFSYALHRHKHLYLFLATWVLLGCLIC